MRWLSELWEFVLAFMDAGGPVLWLVALVLFVMWSFIIERIWYFYFVYPREARLLIARWDARNDTLSWRAHRIREAWISQYNQRLQKGMPIIKTMVALCPLVGLLGTVTGMINVFEGMAAQGTGSARVMANGIFSATIPTMAGMVAALSGLFVSARLEQTAETKGHQLADNMPHH